MITELDIEIEDALCAVCERTGNGATSPEIANELATRGFKISRERMLQAWENIGAEWVIPVTGNITDAQRNGYPTRVPAGHPHGHNTLLAPYVARGSTEGRTTLSLRHRSTTKDRAPQ